MKKATIFIKDTDTENDYNKTIVLKTENFNINIVKNNQAIVKPHSDKNNARQIQKNIGEPKHVINIR